MVLEAQVFKAWVTAGPAELKEEAPNRVKKEGWKSARDALATTVRSAIPTHLHLLQGTLIELSPSEHGLFKPSFKTQWVDTPLV